MRSFATGSDPSVVPVSDCLEEDGLSELPALPWHSCLAVSPMATANQTLGFEMISLTTGGRGSFGPLSAAKSCTLTPSGDPQCI